MHSLPADGEQDFTALSVAGFQFSRYQPGTGVCLPAIDRETSPVLSQGNSRCSPYTQYLPYDCLATF